ncbi:hypothetical protein [Janibacter sp. GS2]|uniref:hypothetical protein n=1 Tax=Janibacter sp. GS2 TaxID=3442646 RepID=UPI003EB9FF5A
MADLQVLLDPRGVTGEELRAGVGTLLTQVPAVELVHPTRVQSADLTGRFGSRVISAVRLRTDVPVLVTSGDVCFASGAVRRVLAELDTPGRSLTRILLSDSPVVVGQVACWAPQWLSGYSGTVEGLVEADLDFDREHLSRTSSVVRSWVRADAVGMAPASTVGEDPQRWSRRTGRALVVQDVLTVARAPAGAVRRRLERSGQRRRYAASSPDVEEPGRGTTAGGPRRRPRG